eukprot:1146802-Pelagomonas_calceolata.AAC.2
MLVPCSASPRSLCPTTYQLRAQGKERLHYHICLREQLSRNAEACNQTWPIHAYLVQLGTGNKHNSIHRHKQKGEIEGASPRSVYTLNRVPAYLSILQLLYLHKHKEDRAEGMQSNKLVLAPYQAVQHCAPGGYKRQLLLCSTR